MHNDYEFGTILYGASDYRDFSQNQKLTLNDPVIFLEQSINPDGVKCYLVLLNDPHHTKLYLPHVYFNANERIDSVLRKVWFDWIDRHQDLGSWIYDVHVTTNLSNYGADHYDIWYDNARIESIYVGKLTERFHE